jgi:hypothetical protein
VPDTIKCNCQHCGAKYRLPIEAQGRSARCKRCGKRFDIPREQSLEDSVLTWLTAPEDEPAADEDMPSQPKVISMPKRAASSACPNAPRTKTRTQTKKKRPSRVRKLFG